MIDLTLTATVQRIDLQKYLRVVFLDEDYTQYVRLRESVPPAVQVERLGGRFDEIYPQLCEPIIQALQAAGNSLPANVWWSGQVASRSSTATALIRNIIYAAHVRDILADANGKDILFVCADVGLLECCRGICAQQGIPHGVKLPALTLMWDKCRVLGKGLLKVLFAVKEFVVAKLASRAVPIAVNRDDSQRRVLIRSWVTEPLVTSEGQFQDRNFGELVKHYKDRGWSVVFLPMLFNLKKSRSQIYRQLAATGESFLFPHHYVGAGALYQMLSFEWQRARHRWRDVVVDGINVSAILNYENHRHAFDPYLMELNLADPLLKCLQQNDVKIDLILYPFENNAPEKLLLLAKQAAYPDATIIGYQHSVWLSRQAGATLIEEELPSHPLPDAIVCPGKVYPGILAQLGFPAERLQLGASFRFQYIHEAPIYTAPSITDAGAVLFLPLPFEPNLCFELLARLRQAITPEVSYQVRIKLHPLLDQESLERFVKQLAFPCVAFTEKSVVDGLAEANVALMIGTSVSQLEAIACGVPLVRVIPENTFSLDPLAWLDYYPISPVQTQKELSTALGVSVLLSSAVLGKWAETIRHDYFETISEAGLGVFTVPLSPPHAD